MPHLRGVASADLDDLGFVGESGAAVRDRAEALHRLDEGNRLAGVDARSFLDVRRIGGTRAAVEDAVGGGDNGVTSGGEIVSALASAALGSHRAG